MTAILPSAVAGQVLSTDNLHSLQLVKQMLHGSLPRYPRLGFCIVDVRDVVDLYIRAMTAPQAAGERFVTASDWMWIANVAHVMRSELGASTNKVPTRPMPDVVLRIAAMFERPMRFVVPLLGRKHVFTAAKARAVLGWEPRPSATTIIDSARSVIGIGAV